MTPRPSPALDLAVALLIGGVLIVALPRYSVDIAQVLVVTLAALAGLFALSVHVPPTLWMSPFKWMSPFGGTRSKGPQREKYDDVQSIRSTLSGWRQPLPQGPPLPPAVLRLMRPLIAGALDMVWDGEAPPPRVRKQLTPLAWAVLTSDPERRLPWYRMVAPNRREVSDAVHSLLDEIESLKAGSVHPSATMKSH
jgi:hypothetical protein